MLAVLFVNMGNKNIVAEKGVVAVLIKAGAGLDAMTTPRHGATKDPPLSSGECYTYSFWLSWVGTVSI